MEILDSSSGFEYTVNLDAASSLSSNMSCFLNDLLELCPEVVDYKIVNWSETSEGSGDLDSAAEEARFRKAKALKPVRKGDAIRQQILTDAKARARARAYRPKM